VAGVKVVPIPVKMGPMTVMAYLPLLVHTGHDERPFSLEELTDAFGRD
jgi:hypothetical protein